MCRNFNREGNYRYASQHIDYFWGVFQKQRRGAKKGSFIELDNILLAQLCSELTDAHFVVPFRYFKVFTNLADTHIERECSHSWVHSSHVCNGQSWEEGVQSGPMSVVETPLPKPLHLRLGVCISRKLESGIKPRYSNRRH